MVHFIIGLFLIPAQPAPEFSFVECETTHQHVSVQPKLDHYVVHFHTRIRDLANTPVFVRVRCRRDSMEQINLTKLIPSSNDELWSMYFRVPKYSDQNQQNSAIYQIELGIEDLSLLDPREVHSALAFRINQDQAGESVDYPIDDLIPVTVRRAIIEGGEIRIYAEARVVTVTRAPVIVGMTDALGDEQFDGDRSARRIDN